MNSVFVIVSNSSLVTLKIATLFCIIYFDVDCVKVIGVLKDTVFGDAVISELNSLRSVPDIGFEFDAPVHILPSGIPVAVLDVPAYLSGSIL
jgi:hypothetical protein